MNEAVRPKVLERATPAFPEAPAPKAPPRRAAKHRSRRRLVRLMLVVALAAAAIFAWHKIENIAPLTGEAVNSGRRRIRPRPCASRRSCSATCP